MLVQRRIDLSVRTYALVPCLILLLPLYHLKAADAAHGLPAKIELDPLDIIGNRDNVPQSLTSAREKVEG